MLPDSSVANPDSAHPEVSPRTGSLAGCLALGDKTEPSARRTRECPTDPTKPNALKSR